MRKMNSINVSLVFVLLLGFTLCLHESRWALASSPAFEEEPAGSMELATVSEDVEESREETDSEQKAQEASEKSSPPEGGPLFVMMVPNEVSRAPRTRMIRSSITAARKKSTLSKTCY